jgi:hypothetical protein
VELQAEFSRVTFHPLTPFRMIVLRLLNLTILRSVRLGNWFKRQVVKRLITSGSSGGITLQRTVGFGADQIRVEDHLIGGADMRQIRRLWRPGKFSTIHMASARYFHPSPSAQPLTAPQQPPGRSLEWVMTESVVFHPQARHEEPVLTLERTG